MAILESVPFHYYLCSLQQTCPRLVKFLWHVTYFWDAKLVSSSLLAWEFAVATLRTLGTRCISEHPCLCFNGKKDYAGPVQKWISLVSLLSQCHRA